MSEKPNYKYWSKVDGVYLWQAIRLLYDEEPIRAVAYNDDENDSFAYKDNKDQFEEETEQYELYRLCEIAIDIGTITSRNELIKLSDFYGWATSKGFPKNKEMVSAEFMKVAGARTTIPTVVEDIKYKFMRNSGGTWDFIFNGQTCDSLTHCKGFYQISLLLQAPNVDIGCYSLVPTPATDTTINDDALYTSSFYESEILPNPEPTKQQRALWDKIKDLETRIEDLKEKGKREEAEELEDEKNVILKQYKKDSSARETKDNKNARDSVRKNILNAYTILIKNLPALEKHLRDSITFGHHFRYGPPEKIDWCLKLPQLP